MQEANVKQSDGSDVELTVANQANRNPTASSPAANAPKAAMSAYDVPLVKKRTWYQKLNNKGDISNIITFCIMVVAIVLKDQVDDGTTCTKVGRSDACVFVDYLVAFGLFGFAGGFTNWLAVKMLFDRITIPGTAISLIGSGVIPRQFKAIRRQVKDTMMKTFFDEDYLQEYLRTRSKSLLESIDIGEKIGDMLSKPGMDELLTEKFTELAAKPEGMMLNSMAQMFGGMAGLVPMVKPMLVGFGKEMGGEFAKRFDIMEVMSVAQVRSEIDALMEEKLLLLTPELVKGLMEEVIRSHLGWLIVWGNIFGGLIGVVSLAAGYG